MNKEKFIEEIKKILLIEEEIDQNYDIKIESLESLMLIQFFDQYFEFKLTAEKIGEIRKVGDLVKLIEDKLIN